MKMTQRAWIVIALLAVLLSSSCMLSVHAKGLSSSSSSPFAALRGSKEAAAVPGDDLLMDIDQSLGGSGGADEQEEEADSDADEDDEDGEDASQGSENEEEEDDGDDQRDDQGEGNEEEDDSAQSDDDDSENQEDAEDDSRSSSSPSRRTTRAARKLRDEISSARARLSRLDSQIGRAGGRQRRGAAASRRSSSAASPRASALEREIAAAQARLSDLNNKIGHLRKRSSPHAPAAAAAAPSRPRSTRWLYEDWHKKLLAKMWNVIRRTKKHRNREQYRRLLRVFNHLTSRWANRRAHLRATLQKMKENKKLNREAKRKRREALRKVARDYRHSTEALRSRYEHKYMRYLKLISRFFRRKYKVLVVEYLREHRQNVGMKKAMWALRGKLHNALRAQDLFQKLRLKRAELERWMKIAKQLRARLAETEAKLKLAQADHDKLKKTHADTSKNLQGAQATIAALQKQVADLTNQLAARKAALDNANDQLNKSTAAAKKAADDANAKYNSLLKEYQAALAKHGALSDRLTKENNDLRAEISRLKNRCIPDVCGVCGGDESSCAKLRSPSTCHAVGDPHYRSWDGYTFNYQVDGEFSLARHLNDFEVQNLQRLCPNPMPRCNKGMAVRAGQHVVVVYAEWGAGTILVNGQKVRTVREKRVELDSETSYTAHTNMVEVRYKDAHAAGYILPWGNTFYMDLYVTAPPRWSNGRSLSGLCGNFNGDATDDAAMIAGATKYWVASTSRSMFQNPNARSEADLEVEDRMHDKELQTQSAKVSATLASSGSVTGEPDHNVQLAFKDAEQKKLIEEKCGKGVHGKDRKDCEFDLLAGAPSKHNRHAFQMTQLLDHEKLLLVCLAVKDVPSASINAARLASDEHREGFTVAFWFQPGEEAKDTAPHSLLARGTQFSVNTQGDTLVVRHGEMQCLSPKVINLGQWIQVIIAVSHKGSITTYIGGVKTCHQQINDPPKNEFTNEALTVVDPSGSIPPAEGFIARLFYLPLTIEERDTGRYAHREIPKCSAENSSDRQA